MKFILILFTSIVLMASTPKSDQNDPAFKLYFQAYEFVLDEQWDFAIKSFTELTKKYTKSNYYDDAFYWIAYATNEKGRLESAYDLFNNFVKEFPKSNLIENANRDIRVIAEHQIDKGSNKAKYKKTITDYDNSREDFEDYELQEQVVFAIYNQGGKASSEKLYKIVMNKKRRIQIREKALFWLGQTEAYSVKKNVKII
jgi:tetratricopeptide (TPR) repeat protein